MAFHHAGLELPDRAAVEKGYSEGSIGVLCCTTTLAVGINLPCHLVIIKNTVTYHTETSTCREYSDLDIMQMIGRAGRPQFDESATAVIMTRAEKARHYERMVQGEEMLESKCVLTGHFRILDKMLIINNRLHLNLIEHLVRFSAF